MLSPPGVQTNATKEINGAFQNGFFGNSRFEWSPPL